MLTGRPLGRVAGGRRNEISADAVSNGAADVLDHGRVVTSEVEERERVERHEEQRMSDGGPSRRGAGRERNNSSDVQSDRKSFVSIAHE